MPLYPFLALASRLVLAEYFDGPSEIPYPKFCKIALFV